MQLCLMGGTFDPPHWGHAFLAEFVRTQLSIGTIVFVPAYIPPHKQDKTISSTEHRVKMLELVCADHDHFQVDTREIDRAGVSYSIDTVRSIADEQNLGKEDIGLLIGADNFLELETWKDIDNLVELCQFLVVKRPEFPIIDEAPYYNQVEFIDAPVIDISGSKIRERLGKNLSIKYFVLPQVEQYIHSHQLYR